MNWKNCRKAVIVGGTSGIGYGIARKVAADAPQAKVIISGRHQPDDIAQSNIEFVRLDATSMREIKKYTDALKSQQEKIDLLVLSQGVISFTKQSTEENLDKTIALMYTGRQMLIRELLPVLTNDARVIIILNAVRGDGSTLDYNNLDLNKKMSLGKMITHPMTLNDGMVQWFAREQIEKNKSGSSQHHRLFVHAFPGWVKTDIGKTLPWPIRMMGAISMYFKGVSADECAVHMLNGSYKDSDKEGWLNINDVGDSLNGKRHIFTDEQLDKIAKYTWESIDNALLTPQSTK
ncbi:WW domain-containing oxidoreductase [Acrasis kona]|uniref:WW domain-containing oxidoreductase n=1 Tax=Acrasis kona TaxID=1008807 RepID=A0AAW2ZJY6_9EUKA